MTLKLSISFKYLASYYTIQFHYLLHSFCINQFNMIEHGYPFSFMNYTHEH